MLSDTKPYERAHFAQNAAVAGPMECWLVLRRIKTLGVRLERHCSNAKDVAEFLAGHAEGSKVIYPAFT
jgi:cystathionine beta-lyase/cystathionine gamma-synthase